MEFIISKLNMTDENDFGEKIFKKCKFTPWRYSKRHIMGERGGARIMEIRPETLDEIIERMAEDCKAEEKRKATFSSDDTNLHTIEKYVRTTESDGRQTDTDEER